MQRYSTAQKYLVGLIALAVLLLSLLMYSLMSNSIDGGSMVAESTDGSDIPVADTSLLIPYLFDYQDPGIAYDWSVDLTETGDEQLVEFSTFTLSGQTYNFLLSTFKQAPNDAEYTIADYLMLTMDVANNDGGIDQVVYTDLEADGVLDSVYLNDVMLPASALMAAQAQYSGELLYLQDYIIGS